MFPHHQETLDKLSARYQGDPSVIALVHTGSLPRGDGVATSDVDFMLVVTDEEYQRREAAGKLHIYDREVADYPDGYAEGTVVNMSYLHSIAEYAGEITRASFVSVKVVWSRSDEVAPLIKKIAVYPEADREKKFSLFHTQLEAWLWYTAEAERHASPYLMFQSTARLLLFGCRLILAHNRIPYPYHKWLMTELRKAPEKPAGMIEAAEALMEKPCLERAKAFAEPILAFRDWGNHDTHWSTRHAADGTWMWQTGHVAIEDW